MQRIEAAELHAIAMHKPEWLERERLAAVADAARQADPANDLALLAEARALAEAIDRGRVRITVS